MASPEEIDGVTEASLEEIYGVTQASDLTFQATDIDKESSPGENKNFEVDPTSHEVANSLETKRQVEVEEKKKERKKKDALQTLKTTILVSAVIVAVAGTVFAVTKKLRER